MFSCKLTNPLIFNVSFLHFTLEVELNTIDLVEYMISILWLRQLPYNPVLPRGTAIYGLCALQVSLPDRQLLTWCSRVKFVLAAVQLENQCLCLKENKKKKKERKEENLALHGKLTRRKALIGNRIIDTVFKSCFPQSNTSNMQLFLKGLISSLSYTVINFIIELVSTMWD